MLALQRQQCAEEEWTKTCTDLRPQQRNCEFGGELQKRVTGE